MGNRANFIVVENRDWRMYYAHRSGYRMLDAFWPGWAVSYAYDGVADLMDYVGAGAPSFEWDRSPQIRLARKRNGLCHLVSVIDGMGNLRFWPLWWRLSQAWHGPTLLKKLPGAGLTRLKLQTIPEGGVHIDIGRKAVGEWHTADTYGIVRELPALWSGWRTESWADRFEEQAHRCGSALRLPELDLGAAAARAGAWIRQREPDAPYRAPHPTPAEWDRFSAACDALRADEAASA